ncbi:MAG: SMC-Scp complex subunit ScpB [Firmicutes bacterium]|nr:SMC-Scp complex subunit ScpB [Bacillota bacterium]
MKLEQLDQALEAVLFVAGESVLISDLMNLLDVQKSEIKASAERLKKKYGEDCGINFMVFNNRLQFCSNPAFADSVAAVLNPIRQKQLTKAAMEAMAIIAYKQPVTRLELEQIRGVNCDYAIQVLMGHKLIEVTGYKDAVGKPALFGTTEEFLKRFGLESISKLPEYNKLLEEIKALGQERERGLYNEFEITNNGQGAEEEPPPFEYDENAVAVEVDGSQDDDNQSPTEA